MPVVELPEKSELCIGDDLTQRILCGFVEKGKARVIRHAVVGWSFPP